MNTAVSNLLTLAILGALFAAGLVGIFLIISRLRDTALRPGRGAGIAVMFEAIFLLVLFLSLTTELMSSTPIIPLNLTAMLPLFMPAAAVLAGGGLLLGLYLVTRIGLFKNRFSDGWPIYAALLLTAFVILLIPTWRSANIAESLRPTPTLVPTATPTSIPEKDLIEDSLPTGFSLQEAVSEGTFGTPTTMTLGEGGELYVGALEGIFVLRDSEGDGSYDIIDNYYQEIDMPLGMVFKDGSLYISSEGKVIRLTDSDGDREADQLEVILEDLPHFVFDSHSNNGLVVGEHGELYVAFGGTSDYGPETWPVGGTILVSMLDGSPTEVYADGLRNPYDMAFCSNGDFNATDNGPDNLEDESLVYVPPDELNLVFEGESYGYPDVFGYPLPWSDTIPPVALLPEHAAATGIVRHEGDNFPTRYHGDIFLTTWLGWQLIHVDIREHGETTIGTITFFADEWGQPIDLVVDNDGSLLVLDYTLG